MSANKTKFIKFNCPVLKGFAKLKLLDLYVENQQTMSPIYKGTRLTNCNSTHLCGVLQNDGTYDWDKCPAHVTLNKGGNL